MVAKKRRAVENGGQERHGGSSGLPKLLASPDLKVRQRAIRLLVAWLSAQKQLTDVDLLKIWKGLFYCLWHSDKAPLQADLIEREWGGIDRLRLDKFYLLIRKVLGSMFKLLHSQNWDEAWITKFMTTISERAFLASDLLPAQGVNLHLAEIFLGELKPFLPIKIQAFSFLLEPFYSVLGHASDKILLLCVKESVFMCLLKEARSVQSSTEKDSSMNSKLGLIASGLPLADRFFELAASKTVPQGNRKILYMLYEESSKLQKPQVASEEFVYQSEKAILQREPLADSVEANPSKSAQVRKKKKQKLESGNISKNHGLSSVTMALQDDSSDVATSNAGTTKIQDDLGLRFPAEKQLVFTKSCTLSVQKGTRKKKQAAVDQLFGEMVKENPDLDEKGEASSLKRKKSTTRSSGHKVIGNKTQMEESNVYLDENMPGSNGTDPKSADVVEGESIDVDGAGDGVEDGDFMASNLLKKFHSATPDDIENSPSASFQAFSQLARSPRHTGSKKQKKTESKETPSQFNQNAESTGFSPLPSEGKPDVNGSEKKVKKVRFSLKHNIVWKPKSPLPPQTLRLPQASTPRGSALKKGVPPGPIQASAPPFKRTKNVILRRWLSDSSPTNSWNLMFKMSPTPMKKRVTLL